MKETDILEKIKSDIIIIENKIHNNAILKQGVAVSYYKDDSYADEVSNIRILSQQYLKLINKIRNINIDSIDDFCYIKERQEHLDVIYEQIKDVSDSYLDNNYNIYYKKIMDAFDNIIEIFKICDEIKRFSIKRVLDKQINYFTDKVQYIEVKSESMIEKSIITSPCNYRRLNLLYKASNSSFPKNICCKVDEELIDNLGLGFKLVGYNNEILLNEEI